MKKIGDEILLSIKPSIEEEKKIKEETKNLIILLSNSLKKNKIKAEVFIGGSFAKDTTIKKDKYDVDIFVVFDKKYKSEEISGILEKNLNKIAKAEKLPGSRDYFNIPFKDFKAEIVPVLEIKNSKEAKNITDVSLLHVKYIRNKINKNKKLSDEIRLAKAFCYANECYGAESHIKGFSGYCLEVLISYYGSFNSLIKNASKWKEKVIIDPLKKYKRKNILIELNEAKLLSPLILIDPVQQERNVAAALSKEKFDVFVEVCNKFLKNYSSKFFERKIFDEDKIIAEAKKAKSSLYLVNALSNKKKEDISGAKLLKLFGLLKNNLQKEGYSAKTEWNFKKNEAKMFFAIKKPSAKIEKPGPFVGQQKHFDIFKKIYKNTKIKNKRIYAIVDIKPLDKIFSLEKKQLSEMSIDSYKVKKIL